MPRREPSNALQAEMAAAQERRIVNPDKLDALRGHLRKLRDLRLAKVDLEEQLKRTNIDINEMTFKTLVDAFDACGATSMELKPEGNAPGFEVEVRPYYKANIGAEWPQPKKDAAFAYLTKVGAGDLPRATYTVSFGKDTAKEQSAFEKLLEKHDILYTREMSVPWNTLTAWVREMVEDEGKMPKLDLIGATVGRVASVVTPKKEKR